MNIKVNLAEAFTLDKRAYHDSMLGIMGISSPNNAMVGVTRFLSYNTGILSTRGYLKTGSNENVHELNAGQLMTTAELLTACSANHDAPERTAMTVVQSKHTTPVKKSDKLLIGTGVQKTIPYVISDDFAFKAKEDGVVELLDTDAGMMILKYKDGTKDAVDISKQLGKNGQGGFYIDNTKTTNLKKGSKFKKGDILAKNENYIRGEGNDCEFMVGTLAKVAIYSGYYTFEDSSIITESLSNDMMSQIVMEKAILLGPNTNIDYMVKKGQPVKAGQMLMSFEESYDEKEANMLLSKIGDEFQEEITALGKNIVKSKYTGVVEDIEILYSRPAEEMSPSIQKMIKEYNKETLKKKAILEKNIGKDHNIQLRPTTNTVTENGKIKGIDVGDGVMVKLFIKYDDKMGVGDKLTFYTAVKSVIQQVVPEEDAPYSDYRKDEKIQAVMAPVSYFNRMVGSVMINLYGNKVMVELKRKVGEVYGIDVVNPK